MIQQILDFDTYLFLLLNDLNTPFFDFVMAKVSAKLIWVPFYLIVVFFIFKRFSYKKGAFVFVLIVFSIALADQTSVHLFKNVFQRLRPCFNADIQGLVHYLSLPGGKYGFVSSHAANSFAFATFSLLIFKNTKYTSFIIIWAIVVSYSRIYLGVHYPLDVFFGAILGSFISLLVFNLSKNIIFS